MTPTLITLACGSCGQRLSDAMHAPPVPMELHPTRPVAKCLTCGITRILSIRERKRVNR